MDPDATLALMREAQSDHRYDDADDHAADLGQWIALDGFPPSGISARELNYCLRAARVVAA